jgi:hypothetical protein
MQTQDPERGDWADQIHPKRAWFGPKRFGGTGYAPRTWPGYLVTAVLAGAVIATGTTTKGHGPLMWVLIALLIGVPLAIMVIQRNWLGRR